MTWPTAQARRATRRPPPIDRNFAFDQTGLSASRYDPAAQLRESSSLSRHRGTRSVRRREPLQLVHKTPKHGSNQRVSAWSILQFRFLQTHVLNTCTCPSPTSRDQIRRRQHFVAKRCAIHPNSEENRANHILVVKRVTN
jgi:hypothetical protein